MDEVKEVKTESGEEQGTTSVKGTGAAKLYITAIMALLLIPLCGMAVYPTTEPIGNTDLAELPALMIGGQLNSEYVTGLGDYLESRFAFRPELVSAHSLICREALSTSSQDSAIVGEDGWLYYSATLGDYQHTRETSERKLFNIAHNIALMQEVVEERGDRFLFAIAPNKNALYPEGMPARYVIRDDVGSDAERLLPWLVSEDVNYLDLFKLFGDQDATLYYKRDSHWNETGAVLVYNAMLDQLEEEHETYEGVKPIVTEDYYGDLNQMLFPVGGEPEATQHYLTEVSWEYTGEADQVEADYIETANQEAEQNSALLIYRDSFGNSLLPYLAEHYENAIFSKVVPYPEDDLDRLEEFGSEKRDVIVERVERHLSTMAQVPPLMSSPVLYTSAVTEADENSAAGDRKSVAGDGNLNTVREEEFTAQKLAQLEFQVATETAKIGNLNGWISVTGALAEEPEEIDTRIYVEVTDASISRIVEAYCISGSGSDYGYTAYLSPDSVDGDIENIRVLATTDDLREILEGVQEDGANEPEGDGVKDTANKDSAKSSLNKALTDQIRDEVRLFRKATKALGKLGSDSEIEAEESDVTLKDEKADAAPAHQQSETDLATTVPAQSGQQEITAGATQENAAPQEPAGRIEVNRTYYEDCGLDTGYWDIEYSDGSHEYIDVD